MTQGIGSRGRCGAAPCCKRFRSTRRGPRATPPAAIRREFVRCRRLARKVELHPEIPLPAPAAVEFEPATVVTDERQPAALVAAHRPVPTAVRIVHLAGETPRARERFVRDADDIEREVVKRIPQKPREVPAALARPIPFRRDRAIRVAEPPHGIQFFPEGDMAQRGVGHDGGGLEVGASRCRRDRPATARKKTRERETEELRGISRRHVGLHRHHPCRKSTGRRKRESGRGAFRL